MPEHDFYKLCEYRTFGASMNEVAMCRRCNVAALSSRVSMAVISLSVSIAQALHDKLKIMVKVFMGFVWFLGCFVASVDVKVPPVSYWLSHIVILIIFPGSAPETL